MNHINAVAFSADEVCPQFSRIADVLSTGRSYLNQIAEIRERVFLYHAEPILSIENGSLEGVSIVFQDVDAVMKSDISIRRKLITKENRAIYTFDHILGNSASMTKTLKLALRYSKVDEPILLRGETGVGKEMFAQAIHRSSRRRNNPFVAINCASLPESILESELFGYVKGAFTGANREGKRGLFELAHTGTIFLDEIGELSLSTQGKLLRVLQEYSIRRIGGETPIPVDVRIITATNRDLISMVHEGEFRADLYFRINVLGLQIPPLRERKEDIGMLADMVLSECAHERGRKYYFSPSAKEKILQYDWPGNVRELQNMIHRVTVISESNEIGPEAVEDYINENQRLSVWMEEKNGKDCEPEAIANRELTLEEALTLSKGNKVRAAELLGVSRATLYRMIGRKEM